LTGSEKGEGGTMKRSLRIAAVAVVLALVAVACSSDTPSTTSNEPSGAAPQKGGTLKIVMNSDVTHTMDPQIEYYQLPFAYFRCCLLRTLWSYNGLDAAHDGTKVFPDLAAGEPTVSQDGLTYTIPIKQGLMYAPPLDKVEITAEDFIRPIERGYTVGGPYMGYYDVIQGATEYASGDAKTISGMRAVDDHTLEVTLTDPIGDFEYRFAMAAAAPIPPNPDDPNAKFGVAEGHDDSYGPFLVSMGPYMFDGSPDLDFSVAPDKQKPVSGYRTARSMLLVRNPSWAQDDLRKAYADEIDVSIQPGAESSTLAKEVENDEFDTMFANGLSPERLKDFQTNPDLEDQIFTNPSFGNYYLSMNLAEPPFDDVFVRRAVNYAVNKEGWRRFSGGEISGSIATHYTPDTLLNNLLANYDPYPSPNNAGADSPEGLQSAKDQMKQSKYDSDGDGICDAPECDGVLAIGVVGTESEAADALIASNLEKIGVKLDLKSLENSAAYNKIFDPTAHVALTMFSGWLMDYPDPYTFYWFTNYGGNILDEFNTNYSLIGATPEQLKKYGYDPSIQVPSLDDKINECIAATGDARVQCWADADKQLAEDVVAYVPLVISQNVNIVSSCVTNYQWSVFDSQTAFEQVAKIPGCND
jgi:peptide/nickel transport system substrate-binding protein